MTDIHAALSKIEGALKMNICRWDDCERSDCTANRKALTLCRAIRDAVPDGYKDEPSAAIFFKCDCGDILLKILEEPKQ